MKYSCIAMVLPALSVGFVNYYILDMGEESFRNDAPIWYVLRREDISNTRTDISYLTLFWDHFFKVAMELEIARGIYTFCPISSDVFLYRD